jgi:hypothetical protein
VSTIVKISGKPLRLLGRLCSLLKLLEEMQNSLQEGMLGSPQGYLFAANFDHPKLMEIFQEAIGEEWFTNDGLERALQKGRNPATTEGVREQSFPLYRCSVQSVKSGIKEQSTPSRNATWRHCCKYFCQKSS